MTRVVDQMAPKFALWVPEPLRAFNRAGVLDAADVRIALTLLDLAAIDPSAVGSGQLALATALAVRGPRLGHVFVDLADVARTSVVEEGADGADEPGWGSAGGSAASGDEAVGNDADLTALPWPEPSTWTSAVAAAEGLVACGDEDVPGAPVRPLRLVGTRLYLDRYWREERELAARLLREDRMTLRRAEFAELRADVERLFPHARDADQRVAAVCACLRGLTVIAGGPGTGKTTTVAGMCALLLARPAAATDGVSGRPLIGLCAPTARAAARLEEAVHRAADAPELAGDTADAMRSLRASTIHRLLDARGRAGFRYDATNQLPYDIVIVDETSMVSLSLMGSLVAALRRDARIVLVGDPDQLSAIEAGAVLRDIVGPAADAPQFSDGMRGVLLRTTGVELPAAVNGGEGGGEHRFGSGIAVLRRTYRYGKAIGALADAIRRGDPDGAVAAAGAGDPAVVWINGGEDGEIGEGALVPVRDAILARYGPMVAAARAGDGAAALAALSRFRLLCAHRFGAGGVSGWNARIERWLASVIPAFAAGREPVVGTPLLITANDYELRLFNGDVGVLVADPDVGTVAMFDRGGELVSVSPSRLSDTETLFATTVHKAQGSQFPTAAVCVPDAGSRLSSRELLYTAVTRAQDQLLLIGSAAAIAAAVQRPVARASALGERLWGVAGADE